MLLQPLLIIWLSPRITERSGIVNAPFLGIVDVPCEEMALVRIGPEVGRLALPDWRGIRKGWIESSVYNRGRRMKADQAGS